VNPSAPPPAADAFEDDDLDPEDSLPRMTLSEHLDELRRRLVRAVLAIVVGMVIAFVFHKALFQLAVDPFEQAMREVGGDGKIQSISPLELFLEIMKLAFLTSLVATSPYVLWQMWGFIAAGLYPSERKAVRTFFPISVALFALGCATAFLMILPIGMRFLLSFGRNLGVANNFSVGPYLSLCISLLLGMGFAFELPLVMLFLQATGIVERETFHKGWRIAVLSAFVLGMVLTPDPTPVSQILMAAPLVGLYFLGVWGGRFVGEAAEKLTVWKAWPLALTLALFGALFFFRHHLQAAASSLFS